VVFSAAKVQHFFSLFHHNLDFFFFSCAKIKGKDEAMKAGG
jgi:hypothetical protein